MKKIIFVMPKFGLGGAEKSLLILLKMLSNFSYLEITLLLFRKEGDFINELPNSVKLIDGTEKMKYLYPTKSYRGKKIKKIMYTLFRCFATFLSKIFTKNNNSRSQFRWRWFYSKIIDDLPGKYDLACGFLDGEAVYYVAEKVNASLKIAWNQNDYRSSGFNKKIDNYYFSKIDKIIVISNICESIMREEFPQFANKLVQIQPLILRSYLLEKVSEYMPAEVDNDVFSICSVGRLVEQKGFDLAIEAAKILKSIGLHFKWFIIGNGELFDSLKAQIEKNGLLENVFLLGEKKNPNPYIYKCDIFVQTSRYEGKSVVLDEAKVIGKPIIITNYPTAKDQIINNVNGLIVDMNAQSIANGIKTLMENKELMNSFIENLSYTSNENKIIEDYKKIFCGGN